MNKFKDGIFDLTPEGIESSKMIYSGKIIKCLVAPYHTYTQLEEVVPFTKNTYLFPEREMSLQQLTRLISMVVNSQSQEEFIIITANQNIIMDMIGECVRVLTEGGDIVYTGTKTFMANIHDIRYNLLENKAHQISDEIKNAGVERINKLITKINLGGSITNEEYKSMSGEIDIIGEPIIRTKLKQMLRDLKVI